jgi:hypothetical protein
MYIGIQYIIFVENVRSHSVHTLRTVKPHIITSNMG